MVAPQCWLAQRHWRQRLPNLAKESKQVTAQRMGSQSRLVLTLWQKAWWLGIVSASKSVGEIGGRPAGAENSPAHEPSNLLGEGIRQGCRVVAPGAQRRAWP